jgi:hypothetical protein
MGKKRAIIEERQRMLDEWSVSGQSIKTFCKERNIAYPSFFYWQKKLGKENQEANKAAFLEVPSTFVCAGTLQAEVIYSNGNRIALYVIPDAILLKQLVQ